MGARIGPSTMLYEGDSLFFMCHVLLAVFLGYASFAYTGILSLVITDINFKMLKEN